MRGTALLALTFLFCAGTSASAGLYNTSEPDEEKVGRDNFTLVFRDTLLRLRTIGMPKVPLDNPLRQRYRLQADLASRIIPPDLTTEQKLNLSAVFIRCKKADDAKNLLEPLSRREPKNFLVLGNLATAYQQVGLERRAIDTLEQALPLWPQNLGDVPEPMRTYLQPIATRNDSYDLFHKAERYQLKLLKLRAREGLAGKRSGFETVDALFDDGKNPPGPVRFIGAGGKFEPGKLAPEEKAKLPKDAIEIVQQLLIWLPEDARLYWLLGELYNAQGGPKNIRTARMIFDELAGYDGLGVRAAELAEHRMALRNYQDADTDQTTSFDLGKGQDEGKKNEDQGPRIDWQSLGVGFGVGVLIAIFGMWQIREIRRRLQKRG
jgi:tetratricopeptide (TPR) repeat protein